jgi:hypothetical protein
VIKLDYEIMFYAPTDLAGQDCTVDDIHYNFFTGNIVLIANDCDFSTHWGWIPIVDFFVCLEEIVTKLEASKCIETFSFTESEAVICFERLNRDDTLISISSNYIECTTIITLLELRTSLIEFKNKLKNDLMPKHPWMTTFFKE